MGGEWKQLVGHIIQQEDLYTLRPGVEPAKALLALPASLRAALLKMPLTNTCLLYTSPSPRDRQKSRMPSSA